MPLPERVLRAVFAAVIDGRYSSCVIGLLAIASVQAQTPKSLPTWQGEIAKGLVPYHQLTVDDFRIDDKAHPEADYWVKTFIDPEYWAVQKISPGGVVYAYITQWVVFSGLDKNQTVRKSTVRDMKSELPYAQALCDLSEIRARELPALTPGQLPSAQADTLQEAQANLQKRISDFCAEKFAQAQKEMSDFEKETKKGRDKRKVQQLAAEIRKRLDALPPVHGPSSTAPAAASASPAAH